MKNCLNKNQQSQAKRNRVMVVKRPRNQLMRRPATWSIITHQRQTSLMSRSIIWQTKLSFAVDMEKCCQWGKNHLSKDHDKWCKKFKASMKKWQEATLTKKRKRKLRRLNQAHCWQFHETISLEWLDKSLLALFNGVLSRCKSYFYAFGHVK